MPSTLEFSPDTHHLTGPAGTLPVAADDPLARRFLLLVEGECLQTQENIATLAEKYGYCRQRYYQLLHAYMAGGLLALQPQKTGPKSNYRRTEHVVRQVLRHRFLDPDASPAVLTQKLRQTKFPISQRSVQRVIAEYGLQKKTLRVQPPKRAAAAAHPARRQAPPARTRRRPERRTGSTPAAGR